MLEFGMLVIASYVFIIFLKKSMKMVDRFEKWFTEDRGTGPGKNGWVGGDTVKEKVLTKPKSNANGYTLVQQERYLSWQIKHCPSPAILTPCTL